MDKEESLHPQSGSSSDECQGLKSLGLLVLGTPVGIRTGECQIPIPLEVD